MFGFFEKYEEADKNAAVEHLVTMSSPHRDFFVQVVLSILVATFGMLANNLAIIIGSMLIAPVLYPVMGFAMGGAVRDGKVVIIALKNLLISVLLALIASTIVGFFYLDYDFEKLTELHARLNVTSIEAAVAFFAGMAASFALVKPKLNEALPGVAVSVSLIPPLAATGISLSRMKWDLAGSSFLLFVVNVVGIALASFLVFMYLNFHMKRKVAEAQVHKEEKAIEKEKNGNGNGK